MQSKSFYVVLVLFVLLALAYSVTIPIFEAPDELQHYATIEYLARFKWFPPLGKPTEHLWDQQALQAPLYYLAAGTLTAWVDTSDFSAQAKLQPKPNIGDAELPGKKNAFLHLPSQAFPYQGVTLAVHVARLLSVLLGAGTIFLTFVIARFLFAAIDNWLSLLSAGFLAFIPQFIFIHSYVNNDTAIIFTSTLTLTLLLWVGREGVTPRRALLFGFAVGLLCLSKLMGTVLAFVAYPLFISLIFLRTRQLLATVAPTLLALGMTLLVAGWWYARNQLVYGDPLALNAFLKFVGGNLDLQTMGAAALWEQFRLLRFSTWGLFGHISLLMEPTWIYYVYDALALLGIIGAFVAFLFSLRSLRPRDLLAWVDQHQALLVTLIWLAAVLTIGARWFFAAGIQGRLIYPGMSAGVVLLVWGFKFFLECLGGERLYRYFALSLLTPMLIFAGAVVPLYILPAYAPPPLVTAVPPDLQAQNIIFRDEIKLRGYQARRDERYLYLTFYWETLQTPTHDYWVALRLMRPDGSFWLDYGNLPGMGTTFPTTWRAGEIRRDDYTFELKRFTPEDKPLKLIFGFYDRRVFALTPFTNWSSSYDKEWALLGEVEVVNAN